MADLLLIQCAHEEGVLYFWDSSTGIPWLENVSASTWKKDGGKLSLRWLPAPSLERKPAVLFGSKTGFCVGWPRGRDVHTEPEVEGNGGEEKEDEESEESLDSVYRVLTGRSPFKVSTGGDTEILVSDVLDETTEMNDTFAGRNGRVIASGDLN